MKQEKRKFQIQKEEGASNPAKMSHSTSSLYLLVYSSMYLFVWDFHFLLECFTQNSKLPSTAAMQKQLPLYLWQLGSSLVEVSTHNFYFFLLVNFLIYTHYTNIVFYNFKWLTLGKQPWVFFIKFYIHYLAINQWKQFQKPKKD